jgi:hypothetical protein
LSGLPRSSLPEIAEDLREQADADFVHTFPEIPKEDLLASEAAEVIEAVEPLLVDIVADGGPFADRARSILNRQG